MSLDAVKGVVEIARGILEAAALFGAGWWFVRQSMAKRRIQLDLECEQILSGAAGVVIEVRLLFENRGFVEHRLYDLSLSVHGPTAHMEAAASGLDFKRQLFPRTVIVPGSYGYYFVRPGVRQVITHAVTLNEPCPAIRITAGFNYTKNGKFPHTARRYFRITEAGASPSRQADA